MHHSRRKSGHGLPTTSMTDARKAASASDSKHKSAAKHSSTSTSSRRPGAAQPAVYKSSKSGPSSRDGDRPRTEEDWYDDERESFPQFCMTCEKQFVAKDDRFLYCSEACRDYDQEHGASISTQSFQNSYSTSRAYYAEAAEPQDIIPRASPSRPNSTYFSLPPTPASASASASVSASASSAMAALRSLSLRDASPPSPILASSASGIWPFSSRSTAASPSASSYTQPATVYASTYDHGYYRTGAPNYYTSGGGSAGHAGAERPLPPRRPGRYARPRSIELVTPLLGQ